MPTKANLISSLDDYMKRLQGQTVTAANYYAEIQSLKKRIGEIASENEALRLDIKWHRQVIQHLLPMKERV